MITRALFLRAIRQPAASQHTFRTSRTFTRPTQNELRPIWHARSYASVTPEDATIKHTADEVIEEITELYATAQDEFEIAMEETQKSSVYAQGDREAAREELTKVQEAFKAVVFGPDRQVADEVRRRIGQRIRELEQGVSAMEELANNHD